jgi:hypothetical protein
MLYIILIVAQFPIMEPVSRQQKAYIFKQPTHYFATTAYDSTHKTKQVCYKYILPHLFPLVRHKYITANKEAQSKTVDETIVRFLLQTEEEMLQLDLLFSL